MDETFQWHQQGNDARSWGGIGPSLDGMNALLQGSHDTAPVIGASGSVAANDKETVRATPKHIQWKCHKNQIPCPNISKHFFLRITLVSRCNTCWRLRSTLLSFTCIPSLRYLRSLCAFDCDGKVGFLNMTKLKSLSAVEFKPWANWDNLHSCTSGTPCQLFETSQMPFQCQHFKTLQNTSKHFKHQVRSKGKSPVRVGVRSTPL